MPTNVLSISDGPSTTVSDLRGNPLVIPARILDLLANQFLTDTLLRDAGSNGSSLVSFSESTPLYLGSDVEDVAEFAEIPVGAGQIGLRRIVMAVKRGLGVRVSQEMVDENRMDDVNRQARQLVHTMIRADERLLRAALTNPAIPTIAASLPWDDPAGRPRHDIAAAQEKVGSAESAPTVDGDDVFGFDADTVVLPGGITPVLLDNEEFLRVYKANPLADQSVDYTGKLPNEILGMTALRSRSWPKDRVLVLERNTVGFYSDTRKLTATGLYPEGNGGMGGPTESWRSDVTRKRAIGVDQPLAACWITGVRS